MRLIQPEDVFKAVEKFLVGGREQKGAGKSRYEPEFVTV
jgi:hypothetical protein